MDYKDRPSILVVGDSGLEPSAIVKKMLDREKITITSTSVEDIQVYPWHITTKYYEADVALYTLSEKKLLSQGLAGNVQAVVICFNSIKENGLEDAEAWLPFVKDYDADINILVCHRCTETDKTGVSKLTAQEWCVEQGFELVELDPEVDHEWEAEQDFVETTGIDRVVQAVHAHVWPNLTMNERKEPTSMSALLHGGDLSSEPQLDYGILNSVPYDFADGNIQNRLEELLGGDADTDFVQLFSELRNMKERVAELPSDQRMACAEQVVVAFWKALCPDDETADSILGAEYPPSP